MYSLKDAANILLKIEEEHDVDKILNNELYIWPLVRRELWMYMVNVKSKKVYGRYFYTLFVLPVITPFLNVIVSIKNSSRYKKTNVIMLLNPQHSNLYYSENRYLDPIYDEVKKSTPVTKVVMSQLRLKNPKINKNVSTIFYSSFSYGDVLYSMYSIIKNYRLISRILKEYNLPKFNLLIRIIYSLSVMRYIKSIMGKYLKSSGAHTVFMTAYYFPKEMGVIWASSCRNVTTVDVQHGKQGTFNGVYSHMKINAKNGYKTLPTYFLLWGNRSKHDIHRWRVNNEKHQGIVAGYQWLCKNLHADISSSTKDSIIFNEHKKNKRLILITLQNPQGKNTENFPGWLKDTIDEMDDEYYWLLRMPRNNSNLKRMLGDMFTGCMNVNIEDATNLPLYDLIKLSYCHLTAYSSVAYEADMFSLPTIIFNSQGKELYHDDINNNKFMYCNNKEKIINTIKNINKYYDDEIEKYFLCDDKVFQNAISAIIKSNENKKQITI